MEMTVHLAERSYPICIEAGILGQVSQYLDTTRQYAVVTDDGVPQKWVDQLMAQLPHSFVITIPRGEGSKNFEQYMQIQKELAAHGMNRKSGVIALGGGVVGDLAGFVAATYMRGIDFYNIPTTILSQVDSSVGGKTAIDLGPLKNIIGAFWQPKAVLIDPDVLSTLPKRHVKNGLAEALKMGLILEPNLVDAFEKHELDIPYIIERSVDLKRQVVEEDEKETGLRKILNFGHTIGHAIEGSYGLDEYLHGECVAMGMLYFISDPRLKKRVLEIERNLGLPSVPQLDAQKIMELLRHDKKGQKETISTIWVDTPGHWRIEEVPYAAVQELLEKGALES